MHPRAMHRNSHTWGTPPWTIDFRPAKRPLPSKVDFAIVGAGFAGLSAAAWLARLAPGKSIVVLESGSLGDGASGRTGGIALADTAVGPLPGLGNVLSGYKKILRALRVGARLTLGGAYELAHSHTRNSSPIHWRDSGDLGIVRKVPGGTIDPGRVLSGLARAAQQAGAQILEHAELRSISAMRRGRGSSDSQQNEHAKSGALTLRLRLTSSRRSRQSTLFADQVLLATNAGSLTLSGLHAFAEPKLTFALAVSPLTPAQVRASGLSSRRPFYTVDLPYLWGRFLENNGIVFGAGLVPFPTGGQGPFTASSTTRRSGIGFRDLLRFDIHKGAAAQSLKRLEERVRNFHPAFENMRVTHRWGGPILLSKDFRPIFRRHPRNKKVLILGGFSGHGVALAVYLGLWAAQSLLGLRPLPRGWRRV